jgi:hypothetical protein
MKWLRIVLALIAALFASPALAQNYSATAGSGLTFGAASNAGVLFPYFIPTGATGTVLFSSANPGYVQFNSAQAVSGTFWPYTLGQQLAAASVPVVLTAAQITTLTPPAWSNSNQIGNSGFNALQGGSANAVGNPFYVAPGTGATWAATESGTWTVQPGNTANTTAWLVTGTGGTFPVTSATLATAANQVTEYGYLSTIATAVVAPLPLFNETAWNTVTPYTTGTTNAGTANLYGNVYVDLGKNNGTAGTASASVLTVQGVASMTPLLTTTTLGAGSAIAGKVGIDQTTAGTTNGVAVVGVNAATALAGSGAVGTGALRVAVGIDSATAAGTAPVKGGIPVVNGASTYQTIAASQSAQVLQTSTGATGDYLSHCTIVPATTAPGVVTILDNATAIYSYPGGGTTALLSLIPFTIPVGAVSTSGAWKVTTGANVSVVCVGKFS